MSESEIGGKFVIIAITVPDNRKNEAAEIKGLLDSGFDRVHVRKPDWSAAQVMELLKDIPQEYYPRLTLHQTPEVIGMLEGGSVLGFQTNSRCPEAPAGTGSRSVSCHSVEEAETYSRDSSIDYITLSPVLDSISKNGYKAAFSEEELDSIPQRTIALGGVVPEKFGFLKKHGFAGAAMLGGVWSDIPSVISAVNAQIDN